MNEMLTLERSKCAVGVIIGMNWMESQMCLIKIQNPQTNKWQKI